MYIKNFFKEIEDFMNSHRALAFDKGDTRVVELLSDLYALKGEPNRFFVGKIWEPLYKWRGYALKHTMNNVYHPLNFSFLTYWYEKPFILKGYPKPTVVQEYRSKAPVVIQPVYDGVHVEFFAFPDGRVHGKTRELEYMNGSSLYSKDYMYVFHKTGLYDNIQRFLKDYPDYLIEGELFGSHEWLAGYKDYEKEVDYVAFDILVRSEYQYLPWQKSKELLESYGIPFAEILTKENKEKALVEHTGIMYKNYSPDGQIFLYKQNSEEKMKLFSQEDSLDSAKLRACLRFFMGFT